MTDELERFDDDAALLIAAGRHEIEPDHGAHARIQRRVANAIAMPRRWARAAVGALAIAASVLLGVGLHVWARPAAPVREAATSVPPGVKVLGALADTSGRDELDRAVDRLTHDDPAGALAALDDHRRRHPTGPLTELREALTIEALARAHHATEARAAAATFAAHYPASLLAPAIRDALDRLRDE